MLVRVNIYLEDREKPIRQCTTNQQRPITTLEFQTEIEVNVKQ